MPETTTNYALPYPVGTDLVMQGDDAIEALAKRVEEVLTAMETVSGAMVNAGTHTLANNVWEDVPLNWVIGDLPYGAASVSYYGPARWFMVSFGANVAVNGTSPNGYVRAVFDGLPAEQLSHSDNYQNLNAAIPIRLGDGAYTTVTLQAKANDGSGATGGACDSAYLRVASM